MLNNKNQSYTFPVFTDEYYHVWAVKMKFHLRSQGLWTVVEVDLEPTPLAENLSLAQIRAHEEEKLKKDRAITCIHVGLNEVIFTKIMYLESPKQIWDKIKCESERSGIVKTFILLTLKREFELMKKMDSESG